MKSIKYLFVAVLFCLSSVKVSQAQVVSSEPTLYTDPTQELKIIVDLSQLDQSLDYVQNLITDATNGLDMYIWTWKPFEFPAGHPKVNGEGAAPWKNSNELLKMTQEGDLLYSYTMIPTEFYEVDAATVYSEDIHFLVKPKDGGGYGDPDRKSGDLEFIIDPPNVAKPVVYGFPAAPLQDDVFRIVYDNFREEKASMQNLNADEVYIYLEATLLDGSIIRPSTFFTVGSNPDLQMKSSAAGIYELIMVPEIFFNLTAGQKIDSMKGVVMKKQFLSGADRVDDDYVIDLTCWN